MNYTLAITILRVQHIEQERSFYHETLGFPVDETQSDPHFVMLQTAGPTWLALEDVSHQPDKSFPAGSAEIGLVVDDVDQVWQDWHSKGVNVLTKPADLPFGRAFDATDPEGHFLTVFKPVMG